MRWSAAYALGKRARAVLSTSAEFWLCPASRDGNGNLSRRHRRIYPHKSTKIKYFEHSAESLAPISWGLTCRRSRAALVLRAGLRVGGVVLWLSGGWRPGRARVCRAGVPTAGRGGTRRGRRGSLRVPVVPGRREAPAPRPWPGRERRPPVGAPGAQRAGPAEAAGNRNVAPGRGAGRPAGRGLLCRRRARPRPSARPGRGGHGCALMGAGRSRPVSTPGPVTSGGAAPCRPGPAGRRPRAGVRAPAPRRPGGPPGRGVAGAAGCPRSPVPPATR